MKYCERDDVVYRSVGGGRYEVWTPDGWELYRGDLAKLSLEKRTIPEAEALRLMGRAHAAARP